MLSGSWTIGQQGQLGQELARTKLSDVEQDSIRGRPQQQDLRQRTADAYYSVSLIVPCRRNR